MAALATLFAIIIISLIVVRIGAVALSMTGLSDDLARFQAQSAFTGVGFTTNESEAVMADPGRRKIASILMLLGNAGLGSAIATLVITFGGGNGREALVRLAIMVVGLLVVWRVARSVAADRFFTRIIRRLLEKWTKLEVKDYAQLLEIDRGYSIAQIEVKENEWLCRKKLQDLRLNQEGVLVLGIQRKDGPYIGAPRGEAKLEDGDVLTCYGQVSVLEELAHRKRGAPGDDQHSEAARKHRERMEAERMRDRMR